MKEVASPESRSPEVLSYFRGRTVREIDRWKNLEVILEDTLPLIDDLPLCNQALAETGRPDLQIANRATMLPILTMEEVIASQPGNNFYPNLRVYTGSVDTGEKDLGGDPIFDPVPATEEELDELAQIPIFKNYEEFSELRASNKFRTLRKPDKLTKPAFLRMFMLRPDFTKELIKRASDPEHYYNYQHAMPEAFIAYQLMSRLVDKDDLFVTKDGKVDNWHLSR